MQWAIYSWRNLQQKNCMWNKHAGPIRYKKAKKKYLENACMHTSMVNIFSLLFPSVCLTVYNLIITKSLLK
jgi:hypothetical protein